MQPPLSEGNGSPNNNIFGQWLAKTLAGSHSSQSNLKKNAAIGKGVYVGVGLTPIPDSLVCRIRQGDFTDMGELLLESWPLPTDNCSDDAGKPKQSCPRAVTDIFTRLQCFASYVSVHDSEKPDLISELIAYMTTILHVSQDFTGLGWVHYDAAFRHLVALSGNTRWSKINPTLYAMYFTGATRSASRCDLCMATSHKTTECAVLGYPPTDSQSRPHTLEPAVRQLPPSRLAWRSVGKICRLWSQNSRTFLQCCHTHVCAFCCGNHPAVSCLQGKPPGPPFNWLL